jgi:ABC-type amino acid transport substrate-binding protein
VARLRPPCHSATSPLRHLTPLLLCLLLLLACSGETVLPPPPVTPPTETAVVRLGVVSSATSLAALAAEAYEADGVFVEFVPGNQAALLADLRAGQLDGLLLHHIPAGNENWFNPVAVDGLVIVVHPDNPVLR